MIGSVLVIGGGIAGLTLGVALRRAGIEVQIAEIRSDVSDQVGVGMSLQGNCLAALDRIGLAGACIAAGVPTDDLNMRRPDGTLVARQPILRMGGPALPGTCGISRRVLHDILLGAVAQAGATLRLGVSVESYSARSDGVEATLSDGTQRHFDLLVGADGLYSKTRSAVAPDVRPIFCGQAVWRAGVPRPRECESNELHFGGPHGVVGICPITSGDAYVYLVETAAPGTRYRDDELAPALLDKLAGYGGMLRECADHIARSSTISYRPLEWLLMPDPWFSGRVVIIGDAAHCNPPVLAQGAAMGIEDAVVLAECIASHEAPDAALRRFMARRLPRASLVVRNSVQLCEWEVTHAVGPADVARVMRETQTALAQPF